MGAASGRRSWPQGLVPALLRLGKLKSIFGNCAVAFSDGGADLRMSEATAPVCRGTSTEGCIMWMTAKAASTMTRAVSNAMDTPRTLR